MFSFFKSKKLSANNLETIEEELIKADFGITHTQNIINEIKKTKLKNANQEPNLQEIISNYLNTAFANLPSGNLTINPNACNIFSFVGLNGAGKTTSIAKFANMFSANNKVLLIPADTFRAGATKQLELWANELNVEIFLPNQPNIAPATIVYLGVEYALKNNFNVVLIDTSGRLDNNSALMDELTKIQNTIQKLQPSFNNNILVLDATLGSSSVTIANNFAKSVNIMGLIITKLDGVAKAGFIFNIVSNLKKPVFFVGTGEKKDNLQSFSLPNYIKNFFKQ